MKKYRLMSIQGKILDDTVVNLIINFVKEKDVNGEYAQQHEIIKYIQDDCKLSSGKIREILDIMVINRKLSTYYEKPNRYYSTPKIPLPIKVSIGMITSILAVYVIIDAFIPKKIIYNAIYLHDQNVNFSPPDINIIWFVFFCILTTLIITSFWYIDYRKAFK